MKPAEYIIQSLKSLNTEEMEFSNGEEDLVNNIYKFLMSKKFRKYAVNPEFKEHILSAIKLCVSKKEPIKLNLVFGGYKLWRLEESPEIDWAELFSLIYYARWLKPICAIYKPGVWFDFYSDDVILEIMNNVPKQDTEKYIKSFKKLLAFIKPYLPDNLELTLNRVGDQYKDYEDFKNDLDQSIEKIKGEFGGLPTLTPQQIAAIDLNVKLKPGQIEDPKWREKVQLIHEGYARVSKRRPYYRVPDKIVVAMTSTKDTIAVGTTKTSVVKFWVGAGVLEKREDSYIENIFSPKQLDLREFKKKEISIDGLESKNFKRIKIVDNR